MCPHEESNLNLILRRDVSYPLNDGDVLQAHFVRGPLSSFGGSASGGNDRRILSFVNINYYTKIGKPHGIDNHGAVYQTGCVQAARAAILDLKNSAISVTSERVFASSSSEITRVVRVSVSLVAITVDQKG